MGGDRIEMQADAVGPGQRVMMMINLLATGSTMAAGIALLHMISAVGARRGSADGLAFLNGHHRLDVPCKAFVASSQIG